MSRWVALMGWMLTLACGLRAQEPVPEGLTTLHVYANLIQMPTLVLDRWGDPVKPRPGQKFMVSLDKAKPFPATHVRLEGEDPITLTILIDTSNSRSDVVRALPEALAKLAPLHLQPQDHVSIYALDCKLIRGLDDAPAQATLMQSAAEQSMKMPRLHGEKPSGNCLQTRRLEDTIMNLLGRMQGLPGRRVMLVVSEGYDKASGKKWPEVSEAAQHAGVAVFGLAASYDITSTDRRSSVITTRGSWVEAGFDSLCQSSGGKVLTAEGPGVEARLREFIRMLRGRYIVQFPRARTALPGNHEIAITVVGQNYLVRPAGISVPIAGPAELAPQPLEMAEPDPATPPAPGPQ